MATLSDDEISNILSNLQSNTDRASRVTTSPNDDYLLDFIDIDKFLEVLYSMLDSNGYLCAEDDCEDHSKFIFTQEYPDILVDTKRIVSAEIDKRTPANLSANSKPFMGTTVYRPIYLGQDKDTIDGGINLNLQSIYDNSIKLTCWSDKLITTRKLASMVEAIMQKYYWVLRKYVPVFVYVGREDTIVSNSFGNSRYFGIPLKFFVRTNERFILKENELRNIKINYSIG